MTERPNNIRSSRVLEQNYSGGDLNVVRRLLADSNTEESRLGNGPYRGLHRAEHANHQETSSRDRSSRVGRHHADPAEEHHTNRR